LVKGRGKDFLRGATPLSDTPIMKDSIERRVLGRRSLPLLFFPLSFEAIKERGIQGVR
jgi:hypothetical protein